MHGVLDTGGQDLPGLVAPGCAGSQHAGGHPFDHVTDEAAGKRATIGCGAGGCDGSAAVVAEHDDERGVEHAYAVLDGPEEGLLGRCDFGAARGVLVRVLRGANSQTAASRPPRAWRCAGTPTIPISDRVPGTPK